MKSIIYTLIIIALTACTSAKIVFNKDATYYDKYDAETQNLGKAKSYEIIFRDSLNTDRAYRKSWYKSGKVKSISELINDSSVSFANKVVGLQSFTMDKNGKTKWLADGKYKEWYENGQLKIDMDFVNGKQTNQLVTYWDNGKLRRKELYNEKGLKIESTCYKRNGVKTDDTPFFKEARLLIADNQLVSSFLDENIKYPLDLMSTRENGTVVLYSYLDKRGKIYKQLVRRGVHPELNKEAQRVMNKLKNSFIPAEREGEKSAFVSMIPIRFNLPKYSVDILENANAIDSVFYDKDGYILKSGLQAYNIEQIIPKDTNQNVLIRKVFNAKRNIVSESTIDKAMTIAKIKLANSNLINNTTHSPRQLLNLSQVLSGKSLKWQENGNIERILNYKNGILDGKQLFFNVDGAISKIGVFENGKLTHGSVPEVPKSDVASFVESMPQFPGGSSALLDFISSNLTYPVLARQHNITGKVVVRFVVTDTGSIGEVEVLRGIGGGCDEEAVRVVISMPNWIPGTQNGDPVNVNYVLPISFKLQ